MDVIRTPEDELIQEAYRTGGAKAVKEKRRELFKPPHPPSCPTCSSERIVRISPGGKVFKIAALGIFGLGDVHKIFRCLSCGYKW